MARTLVAFANADGGELLVGVEDDATLTGVPFSDEEIRNIVTASETHVHGDTPLPPARKAVISIEGKKIIYFSVSKGTQYVHLTADGRCVRRVDRESLPFSPDMISAHRLEDQSRTWDRETAAGASLDDLDLDLLESVAAQVAYGVGVEKCLQFLDLAEFTPEGLRMKRAAVTLFAKDIRRWHPRCQVRIMTIGGTDQGTGPEVKITKDTVIADNILKLVDRSSERLIHELSTRTQFTAWARFKQTLMYPQIACREALINAIVHRNYAIEGRGIEISIFQDRLEILSPGMLLATVSIEDLRALKGVHESRNPLIARVLREVGLVRELGEGIRRIFAVMRSNALATPSIESDTKGFTVRLYQESVYDPNMKLWLETFDKHKLNSNQVAILSLGYGGREFSTQDIIDRLGLIDTDDLRELMTPLREQGLIERTKTHQQAMKQRRKMGVPKREVPSYRVVSGKLLKTRTRQVTAPTAEHFFDGDESGDEIFLGNLSYQLTKPELVEFLSRFCEVLELRMPSGGEYGSVNKGYAFARVAPKGSITEAVRQLDGQAVAGKPLHVRVQLNRKRAVP